jgi:putative transferase (TIGR04331 family)
MENLVNQSPHFNTVHGNVPGAFSLDRVKISDSIFKMLMPVMNEIHGTSHSFRFWKIVLNDYVNAVISIKHVLEQDALNGRASLLPLNSHHVPTLKDKMIARLPSIVKHFKSPGRLKQIHRVLAANGNISIGLPAIEIVQKETGHPLPLYYPVYPGSGNADKREKVNSIAATQANIFFRNIIKRLPQVYVEYFEKDFNSIKLYDAPAKTFHLHGMPPYYNSLLVAKYLENGAKLFCYQHGAYYGELVGHNSYLHENSLADEYRTWGWKMKPNDVPWKAYRLEKFKQDYDTAVNTIQFDFLMCFPDVYDANIEFYKTGTGYFLQHIDKSKYQNLLARPRPMNRLFSHANRIAFIKDNRVTIDSGLGYMTEVIGKCRLVIQFSIPATNFMECLYVDHPTMGLLDNDQPTDIVKPYYDFLMQQGVLHKDFISLVEHLNKINLDEWWASLIKQPMYLQFKNEFLRKV